MFILNRGLLFIVMLSKYLAFSFLICTSSLLYEELDDLRFEMKCQIKSCMKSSTTQCFPIALMESNIFQTFSWLADGWQFSLARPRLFSTRYRLYLDRRRLFPGFTPTFPGSSAFGSASTFFGSVPTFCGLTDTFPHSPTPFYSHAKKTNILYAEGRSS